MAEKDPWKSAAEDLANALTPKLPTPEQFAKAGESILPKPIELAIPVYDDFEPDDSPVRTAEATETMAEAMVHVVELTRISVENSDRVAKSTKRMSIASLIVSGISGLASIGALVVAVVALNQ